MPFKHISETHVNLIESCRTYKFQNSGPRLSHFLILFIRLASDSGAI